MPKRIVDLRGLGPRMATLLAAIDVHDEDDLRALGAVVAWHRLRFVHGRQVSLIALYAMEAALRDLDWRALPADVKAGLSAQAEPALKRVSVRPS